MNCFSATHYYRNVKVHLLIIVNLCQRLSSFLFTVGLIHEDLQLFLETNLPKPGAKKSAPLGVSDAKLGAAISEELGFPCKQVGVVPEIVRGAPIVCSIEVAQ